MIRKPKDDIEDGATDLVAAPKRRVFEDIVRFLTGEIEAGRLRPGDRLKPERELSAKLGVSRGSLREALKALEMLDVVELRHGLGVYVTQPDPDVLSRIFGTLVSMQPGQSEDIMETREALESHAVRIACRNAGSRDMARIRRALAVMVAETEGGSGEAGSVADHEFHSAIVESTGNATLVFLYNAITGLLKRGHHERWLSLFSIKDYWDRLNVVHTELADAIEARDEERAAVAMSRHFQVIADMKAEQHEPGRATIASIAFRPRGPRR